MERSVRQRKVGDAMSFLVKWTHTEENRPSSRGGAEGVVPLDHRLRSTADACTHLHRAGRGFGPTHRRVLMLMVPVRA